MSPAIRAAVPEDVATCHALRGRTRENAVPPEVLDARGITVDSWSGSVRRGELPGWVCEVGGAMAGYCFGARETGEVVVLIVLPEHEGMGIGRTLLERTMAQLRSFGHERLFLGCARDPGLRSWGFYRHLGWRPTGRFDAAGDEELEFRFGPARD